MRIDAFWIVETQHRRQRIPDDFDKTLHGLRGSADEALRLDSEPHCRAQKIENKLFTRSQFLFERFSTEGFGVKADVEAVLPCSEFCPKKPPSTGAK